MSDNDCPCCGRRVSVKDLNAPFIGKSGRRIYGVYVHSRCGAVLGMCCQGDSYDVIPHYMATENANPERCRYYDLEIMGSDGIRRSHGWFDPETWRVTQVG